MEGLSEEEMAKRAPHLKLVTDMTARLEAEKAAKAASPSPKPPSRRARKVSKTSIFASPGKSLARNDGQESPAGHTDDEEGASSDSLMPPIWDGPSSEYTAPATHQQGPNETYMQPESPSYAMPLLAQQSPGFSRRANAGPSSMRASSTQPPYHRTMPMTFQHQPKNSMVTQQFASNQPMLGNLNLLDSRNPVATLRRSGPSRQTLQFSNNHGAGLGPSKPNPYHPASTPKLGLDMTEMGTPRVSLFPDPSPDSTTMGMPHDPSTPTAAGMKRRLSTPSPEIDEPAQAKIFLQNHEHPNGTTEEVPSPDFERGLYMPVVRPVHPDPSLTARTLSILAPGITTERYSCLQRCRNKGTCLHYHFVLGAKRTPDGLICALCSKQGTEEIICKAKRRCPQHNSDIPVANPISNLAVDYLPTHEQKDRMVEILERSFRNEWTGSIEEIKYATPAEGAAAPGKVVPGAAAGLLIDHAGPATEDGKPNSAPAAMQTFDPAQGGTADAPYSSAFNDAFDDVPYNFHGFAFERD